MGKSKSFHDLGFAKVDIGRALRRGFPEVVYCPGKRTEHIIGIAKEILRRKQDLLLTRLNEAVYADLRRSLPGLRYNASAGLAYLRSGRKRKPAKGTVLVISAGTSDIPVAEEAAATLEVTGIRVKRLYDVGVAGVHRLLGSARLLKGAAVIIVVAGMEGALSSLVSGLVACPVIAVPTSCGYGASFGGLSALLAMLNCCSPGVSVVNIDNGFGAGYFASRVLAARTGRDD
ncbi:MAG: nickel pincer cofactor biosynthesis protein LarB [Candidatus Omnitrophota bacterium]|jgi:NCAIR mutase (PurE)-related protein|nr:nickel pincer cofactor biosynthesis protein LarB [Candidatus Omnitrophota bacterium]MDD3983199.1 nickel pincer cofactor biosynthesis protein LarB [Candidatus Omnitrophota bacterium]